ncbi:dolichyl-phosphate beta-glucosyltransferase [Nannizzia gypsea CBS 118893]|uniref:dolichyl-phosphate beta-glucosyltransferase n=1 Tax=Arthroderma gypseum (strain ATCC MYA-4604 / CBS 118893) TaxID=535722 RepID=E4UTP2_ARTGP|nr:dolichyl-phosphate beta-glucosyltransferase [Nannizzia gypsea CBS 118893]EFR00751.1 dolichyl-phosphate beta-glucosyltransferase [Nannizzia gypsea CBS 118893]
MMTLGLGPLCAECMSIIKDIPLTLLFGLLLSCFMGLFSLAYLLLLILAPAPRAPFPEEKKYKAILEDGTLAKDQQLPCWHDKINLDTYKQSDFEEPTLFMSVVIPAYNEEKRLPGMLEETVSYLERAYGTPKLSGQADTTIATGLQDGDLGETRLRRNANGNAKSGAGKDSTTPLKGWEILIVSDGSTDSTVETALAFAKDHQLSAHPKGHAGPWTPKLKEGVKIPAGSIRVIELTQNRGKGGAVIHGMRHVRGQYAIFADADGASNFNDLGRLVEACERAEDTNGRVVAVGSRAHLVGSDVVVKRSKLRNFLMHSFHLALRLLTPPATARINDTQCGFKLFSRASLPYIIPYMHSEGWIFDVEMLMLAEFANIPVAEVPIGWKEVSGSKLSVVWDSLGMAYGLAILRAAWGFGVYTRAGS